jgi:predicted 3-demethylubiquinone-9 3-methyltransferase (glyoxalase superfamily)
MINEGGLVMENKQTSIIPFLTFPGTAEAAVNFYVSVFPNSKINEITRIENPEHGEVGKVLNLDFELDGLNFYALDMEKQYLPDFTWAISLYKECTDEDEFNAIFKQLSTNGNVLMGPEPIMGLKLATWVTDQFGVTWQLVLND